MAGAGAGPLQDAAEIVADAARRNSSWSERIPASVRTITVSGTEVLVAAGGERAPHAITFEAPNARYWRHPLWARGPRETWDWWPQIPPRRFLLPAANGSVNRVARVFYQAVGDWAKMAGFRPG